MGGVLPEGLSRREVCKHRVGFCEFWSCSRRMVAKEGGTREAGQEEWSLHCRPASACSV